MEDLDGRIDGFGLEKRLQELFTSGEFEALSFLPESSDNEHHNHLGIIVHLASSSSPRVTTFWKLPIQLRRFGVMRVARGDRGCRWFRPVSVVGSCYSLQRLIPPSKIDTDRRWGDSKWQRSVKHSMWFVWRQKR